VYPRYKAFALDKLQTLSTGIQKEEFHKLGQPVEKGRNVINIFRV
jgi:hypothetical protein